MSVEVDPDILIPGDIIRFDYELLTDNETIRGMVVSKIKDAIYSDPRLDYQGSTVQRVGDLALGRDVDILSVYAQVRRTDRQTREEIQFASLANVSLVVMGVLSTIAVYVIFREVVNEMGGTSTGPGIGQTVRDSISFMGFASVLLILWLVFLHD